MAFSRALAALCAFGYSASFLAFLTAPAFGLPIELTGSDRVVSLEGTWKLRAGDDLSWARPDHDDSQWREIRVPTGRAVRHDTESELVWYRVEVRVSGSPEQLGLTLGKIDSAYEVYAGGIRLGGVGSLPPRPRMLYDRHRTYAIPTRVIDEGRLVVALRVWKSPIRSGDVGALYSGPFLLGSYPDLIRSELISELPQLFLAVLILLAGLFHLQLFWRRPDLREYLWFFLLTVCASTYMLLRTQWKYVASERFLAMKEIEYLMVYLIAALFIQVLWPLLAARIGPLLRGAQGLFVTAGLLVAVTPGLEINARLLPLWMLGGVCVMAAGMWQAARGAWRRHPEGRIVVVGAVVLSGTFVNDMVVHLGWIESPALSPYGYGLLVLTMGFALADRFIRVFGELEATAERERQASVDLRRVAEDREQLIAELEARNAELGRFNRAVSHDLKSPLLTIKNFAGVLRQDAARGDAERWRRDLERIEGAADHMRRLVDDLLAYSKASHQARPSEAVAFGELVREALELLAGTFDETLIEVRIAPDLPVLVGDRIRLLQVVQNLLANAMKYMGDQPRPRVEVGVRHDDDETVLYVRDNGVGIEARHHEKVFSLFERLETGTEGTGIGLALVKRIVGLHGGRIWVESDGPGRGSTFCLVLPLARTGVSGSLS